MTGSQVYADPSILVSLLIADANTERALATVGSSKRGIAITPFVRLELTNAFELALFRYPKKKAAIERAKTRFEEMVKAGFWIEVELDHGRCLARGLGLSRGHTRVAGCRSLDILHVASAMELGLRSFLSFDERQRKLAIVAGLEVNP